MGFLSNESVLTNAILHLRKLSCPSNVTQATAAESSEERVAARKRRDTSNTVGSDPDFHPLCCRCLTLTCCWDCPRLRSLLKLLLFVSSPQGGDSLSRLFLRPSPTNPFTPTPFKVCGSPCCVAAPLSHVCARTGAYVHCTPCCVCGGVFEHAVHAHTLVHVLTSSGLSLCVKSLSSESVSPFV